MKLNKPRTISDLTGNELAEEETVEVRIPYDESTTIYLDFGIDEAFPPQMTVKDLLDRGTQKPNRGRKPKSRRRPKAER